MKSHVEKKTRMWSREYYLDRDKENTFENLMTKLRREGDVLYKKFVRVSFDEFQFLHQKIKHRKLYQNKTQI